MPLKEQRNPVGFGGRFRKRHSRRPGDTTRSHYLKQSPASPNRVRSQIPSELLEDVELRRAIEVLPHHYNFEVSIGR